MNLIRKNLILPKVIVIAGPTASGKTSLGINLALKFNGEVISADSRQVFKGLDIGSGKATKDESKGVPHHLIDILNPEDKYNVFQFQKDCIKLINYISQRGKIPIIVGGTGLYIESVVEQYEFSRFKKKSIKKKGLRPNTLVLILSPNRDQIKHNIQKRLLQRWQKQNMIYEVESLIESGVSKKWLKSLGLEYKFLTNYLEERFDSEDEMLTKLNTESWHYAKRQITFFKRWDYSHNIQTKSEALNLVKDFLKKQ
ncbi:MAG: tRNA dimethylallyltransferase [Candidatus Nomurabacteria bacterium]|nr:MAG: tRNA dimethylallyltransferase [Candidatus Nomurabacteria bacterium]HRV75973.1 tRNA (adenosine(37)-N6)-dimethylallyltransferase MiaA [Candidatus Saccharimonadales bacterium]